MERQEHFRVLETLEHPCSQVVRQTPLQADVEKRVQLVHGADCCLPLLRVLSRVPHIRASQGVQGIRVHRDAATGKNMLARHYTFCHWPPDRTGSFLPPDSTDLHLPVVIEPLGPAGG